MDFMVDFHGLHVDSTVYESAPESAAESAMDSAVESTRIESAVDFYESPRQTHWTFSPRPTPLGVQIQWTQVHFDSGRLVFN